MEAVAVAVAVAVANTALILFIIHSPDYPDCLVYGDISACGEAFLGYTL